MFRVDMSRQVRNKKGKSEEDIYPEKYIMKNSSQYQLIIDC